MTEGTLTLSEAPERIRIYSELTVVDVDSVQDYVDVINGLVFACDCGCYMEGNRNEIALDLTVASYMLGMDALEILNLFIRHELIKPRLDDDSPTARVTRALGYSDRFSWDYMIDPTYYQKLGKRKDIEALPLTFVLSDDKSE